jgi:ornithine lipid hydroxylase
LQKLIPWLHYPLVMSSVFVLFSLLQSQGISLAASTYLPIIMAAALITFLEFKFPHSSAWMPNYSELRIDLMFMALVQLVLPPLISFTFIYLLVDPIKSLNLPFSQLWPHAWPIWAQAITMILTVDFLRYWLHRAAHNNQYLWRLHAVHHSVQQLYWLNTARFHPVEKILQMMMDSLPFLLIGVNAQVLALYYLAYATNGFLQHSNIKFRFGILNYLRLPEESNANYGNNVIIWDLLFGTWFLPKNRNINTLGLLEADYPKTFFGLLRAPFKR